MSTGSSLSTRYRNWTETSNKIPPAMIVLSCSGAAMLVNVIRRAARAATNRAFYNCYNQHSPKRILPVCYSLGESLMFIFSGIIVM